MLTDIVWINQDSNFDRVVGPLEHCSMIATARNFMVITRHCLLSRLCSCTTGVLKQIRHHLVFLQHSRIEYQSHPLVPTSSSTNGVSHSPYILHPTDIVQHTPQHAILNTAPLASTPRPPIPLRQPRPHLHRIDITEVHLRNHRKRLRTQRRAL
jgi:hypothetical protein